MEQVLAIRDEFRTWLKIWSLIHNATIQILLRYLKIREIHVHHFVLGFETNFDALLTAV